LTTSWQITFLSLTNRLLPVDMNFLHTLDEKQQRVGAVVLAGGLARRMGGQDKGLVELGNRPMAGWAVEAIRTQVHQLVINANRNHEAYSGLGCDVVADRHSGHIGPLAGLSAAMHHLDTDYVFMCPCDSPFIDSSLVDLLGHACIGQNSDIAVAHDGVRMQPVFCLAHKRSLSSLDAYLESGERKIDLWYDTMKTVEVDCSTVAVSFRNINTEDERMAAMTELPV